MFLLKPIIIKNIFEKYQSKLILLLLFIVPFYSISQDCDSICDEIEINVEIEDVVFVEDGPCDVSLNVSSSDFELEDFTYNVIYSWELDGDFIENGAWTDINSQDLINGNEVEITALFFFNSEIDDEDAFSCTCSAIFSTEDLIEEFDDWPCDCQPVGPPIANFYIENEGECGNEGISFVNTVVGGEGPTFHWMFGTNGEYGESFEASPTFEIIIDGGMSTSIPVTLTVVDDNGCSDDVVEIVEILDTPNPGDNFNIGNVCTGNPNEIQAEIEFQPVPYGLGGIEQITIDWGDEVIAYPPSPFPNFTLQSPVYNDFGYYPVTVELLGFNGCLTVIVDSLFIGNNPQIGSANPGNTDGICGPSDLTFPVLNFANNDPSTVYWVDFGDNSGSDLSSNLVIDALETTHFANQIQLHPPDPFVTHTYNTSSCGFTTPNGSINSFQFKIIAQNECGTSITTVDPVRIHSAPDPVIFGEPFVCAGVEYVWISPETGTWVDDNSTTCLTQPGNWQIIDTETGFPAFLNQANPVFAQSTTNFETTFEEAGIYLIEVLESHPVCDSDSDTFEVCVYPDELNPEALSFPENGCAPLTVNLNDITPPLPCGEIALNWSVDGGPFEFINGTGPESIDPVIVLLEEGDYEITLTHVPDFAYVDSTQYIVDVQQIVGCYNYNANLPGDTTAVEATCPVGEYTIDIEVFDEPYVQISSDEYFLCEGDIINATTIEFNDGNLDEYEFQWFVDDELFSTTIDPITLAFQEEGTHTIEATATNICGSHTSQISVSVNETPTIEVSWPPGDCIGNTVIVEASGADSYQWTNNNQVSSQTGNPVEYTISETTTETVIGVLNHAFVSCESEETFEILAYPLPQIEILGNPEICDEDTLTLIAEITNGTPDYSISWSEQNSSALDSILITEASLGLNYVIADVVDANGCESTEGIGITVYDLPIVEAGANIEFCDQPILTNLEENDPLNGYWDGLGIIDQDNGTIDPSLIGVGTSIINYNYTDSNGCSNTDSLTVTVVDPVFANAGPDIAVCDIDTTLTISGFTPTNGQWIDNSIDSNYNLDVSDLGPGIYPYIYTYGEETCFTQDAMLLEIYERPNIYWEGPSVLCLYETGVFELTIEGGTGPYFIEWLTEMDNISSDGYTAYNSWAEIGTHQVEIFVTDFNGCAEYLSFEVFIYELPEVSAGPDTTFCNQNNVIGQLEGYSPGFFQGGTGYFYGLDDAAGAVSSIGQFDPSISGAGVFNVVYSFTSSQTNCTNTDTLQVIVSDPIVADAGLDTTVCYNAPLLQLEGFYPDIGVLWSGTNATSENALLNSQTGLINPQLLP
ncbi:MAG: hypothetical protein VX548_03685, partial [Bacteroidota bacterium]|nr:hypothetical protein [Bacteroidota bacterium]